MAAPASGTAVAKAPSKPGEHARTGNSISRGSPMERSTKELLSRLALLTGPLLFWGCGSVDINNDWPDPKYDWPNVDFGNKALASAPFHREEDADGVSGVRISANVGKVTVTGSSDAQSIIVTGQRRARFSTVSESTQQLSSLAVNVVRSGDDIVVETLQPEYSVGGFYEVYYEITVPRNVDLRIEQSVGPATLEGIEGNTDVKVSLGNIEAAQSLGANGKIKLKTLTGDIELRVPSSASAMLQASTAFGIISTSNLTLNDRQEQTHSLSGRLGQGDGLIELETFNGSIVLVGSN